MVQRFIIAATLLLLPFGGTFVASERLPLAFNLSPTLSFGSSRRCQALQQQHKPPPWCSRGYCITPTHSQRVLGLHLAAPRYGPPMDHPHNEQNENKKNIKAPTTSNNIPSCPVLDPAQLRQEFVQLVYDVILAKDPQHVPSILTRNMPLILSLSERADVDGVDIIESVVQETYGLQGPQVGQNVEDAVNTILAFAEDFVQETAQMDQSNKELLGQILKVMSDYDSKNEPSAAPKTARQREEALDHLLETSKLSPGFLRHLEGECERIANAPSTTQNSLRLLETLRMIHTRVLAEMGERHLGPAAVVLGQLIGYDSTAERLAVLDAGLVVQGTDFAREMHALTQEALEGFERVGPKADPGLVKCVQELDERLQQYLRERQEDDEDPVEEQGFQ